ncbi:MAG: hypothetical protein ACRDRC_01765 [Pseudonocardiaceae bacterium]
MNATFNETRMAYQAADQTVNNSITLISSTYLVLAVEDNSVYVFEGHLLHTSGTTPDFQVNILLPASSTVISAVRWGSDTAASFGATDVYHDGFTTSGWNLGGIGSSVVFASAPRMVFSTAATAGNCTVQFAQNTANASNTVLKAGSWIRLTKVVG